jgi:hypothetical protein
MYPTVPVSLPCKPRNFTPGQQNSHFFVGVSHDGRDAARESKIDLLNVRKFYFLPSDPLFPAAPEFQNQLSKIDLLIVRYFYILAFWYVAVFLFEFISD